MERRKTRRWGGVLACALTAALALVLGATLPATQAYATDVSLDEPDHAKTVTDNGDGTYKLSLTVKGDSQSSSENTPADVVLAIDTSGSMNDNGKLDNVKRAAKALIDELLTDDNAKLDASKQIQVSVISFDTRADTPTSFTANAGDATQAIDALKAEGGTNWEEALQKANAQNSGRTDARKYVVFFSDGAPTYRISSVQTGTKLGFSFSEGFHKVPAYDEDDTWNTPRGIHGSGNDDPYNANYNSAVTEANKRDVDTVQLFAVSGDAAANDSMTKFANDVTGDFLDGTDADKLNDAFAEIAQTITNSCYYRDVKIVDQLSDYVDFKDAVSADGMLASATVTKTDASGTSPVAGAVAKVDGKKLTVDLSGEGELEADATYTVSFDIRPTADAYDAVAAGTLTNPVPTNVNSDHDATTLEYKTVTKRTGAADVVSDTLYADYDIPTIALPTKQLTVAKTWENARDDARATQPVHVQVTRNGADYGTPVELSASNNWTSTVTVTGNPADASAWGARETDGDLSSYTTNVAVDGLNLSVTNTHKAWSVTVDGATELAGTKTLTGRTLVADEFSFAITPCDGAPAPTKTTATNDAAGKFHFGDITFDTPGTYYYNVAEVTDGLADKGITAQTSTLQVKIDVVEKDGALVAQVSLPDGGLAFANAYKPSDVTVDVTANKQLISKQEGVKAPALAADDFRFTITGDGPLPATTTVSNDAAGNVSFGTITFAKKDLGDKMSKTFTYQVSESGSKAGVTNDSDKTFTVTVRDNADGTMTAEMSPIDPFVNTYAAAAANYSVSNDITMSKQLDGRALEAGDFTFELVDANGKQAATATNDANGTVVFKNVTYTTPGEYTYTVREVNDGKGGVTYDASTYQVKVTVADNGKGKLDAKASSDADAIVFKNSYAAAPASVSLSATKVLEGAQLTDDQFGFEVLNKGQVVARGKNAADGTVSFGALALNQPGTYSFQIREVNDGQQGVTYDGSSHDVKVVVTDDGDGQLTVSSVEGDNPTFTNSYTAPKQEEKDNDEGDDNQGGAQQGNDKQMPQTGDTNNATVPVVLGAAAVVCVAAGLVIAKHRK